MSTLNGNDLFLVQRDGQLHKISNDQMSTLNDDDLLLVERAGTQYKLEARDLSLGPTGEIEAPVEVLTPLNGSGVGALQPYNPISSAITTIGASGSLVYETSQITAADESGTAGITPQVPVGVTGDWASILGVVPTDTSGPSAVFPDGGGSFEGDSGYFYWEDLNIGDKIRWYGNTSDTGSRLCSGDIEETGTGSSPGNSLTPIELTVTAASGRAKIDFNGLTSCYGITPSAPATLLTFEDSTNLDKFQGGDEVGSGTTANLSQSDYDIIFGGTTPNAGYAEVASFTADFANTGFTGNTVMYSNIGGVNGTFTAYAKDRTTVLYTIPIQTLTGIEDLGVNFEDIGRIEWSADFAATMSYFTAGGEYVNPPLLTGGIPTVVSVDAANSQMIVSGGDWVDAGATSVSRSVPYALSVICSDDSELQQMIGPVEMTDENGDLVTPQTSEIVGASFIDASTVNPDLKYAIAPTDFPGTAVNDQSASNFNTTWSAGSSLTIGSYVIIDKGEGYKDSNLVLTPYSSGAAASGSNDLINWTQIPGIPSAGHGFVGYRYIWPQSTINAYGGGVTYTSMEAGVSETTLTFADNTDLEYFQPGDALEGGRMYSDNADEAQNAGGTPLSQAFDGVVGIGLGYNDVGVVTGSYQTYEFDPLIDFEGGSYTVAGYDVNGAAETFAVVYEDGTEYKLTLPHASGMQEAERTGLPPGKIKYMGGNSPTTAFSAIYLNNQILVDGLISVVSVDPDNNQMVVDGGQWDATNQDEVWSNLLSAPGGVNNATNAFNGEIGADAGCVVVGETLTFDVTGKGLVGGVKVVFNTGNAGDYIITATGTGGTQSDTQTLGASTAAAETPTLDVGTLQTITLSNTAGAPNGLAAIYIANRLLVDAVDDSEIWSDNLYSGTTTYDGSTTTKDFQPAAPATLAFDGDDSTVTYENGSSNWIYFRPSSAITVASKIEFGTRNTVEVKVNGDAKAYTGGSNDWSTNMRSVDFSGQLTEFAIRDLDNTGSTGLSVLKVDGKLLINTGTRSFGETSASLPTLEASATDVIGHETATNSLFLSGVTGEWRPALHVKGAEISGTAPSPESIVFTSMNGGTTPFTGSAADLASRTWTLESGPSSTGPWTVMGTYTDFDASVSQDGATPWTTTKPVLEPFTYYQVKVRYDSINANSVESIYSTFKTGDNQ